MRIGKGLFSFVLTWCVVFYLAVIAQAAPNLINYQGVLNNSGGNPVNVPVDMEFRIFDAVTGGNLEWGESQDQVPVSNGKYTVILGSGILLPASPGLLDPVVFANSDRWLEITVNDEGLSPRQRLGSAPYALKAGEAGFAQSVADGAIDSSSIVPGSITANEIAAGTITSTQLDPSILTLDQLAAACPSGQGLFRTAAGWECKSAISFLPGDNITVNCYDGPPATLNVGTCIEGTRTWTNTGPGPCNGQVVPGAQICDSSDNDCNSHDDCYELLTALGWNVPETFEDRIGFTNSDRDPHVTMDNNGNSIIVWREAYKIYKNEFRNGSWTHPNTTEFISPVGSNNYDEPMVAMSDNGDAVIVWIQKDDSGMQQVFMSEYRSGSWTHPTTLSDNISPDGQWAYAPQVAMDKNGNAIIVWYQFVSGGDTHIFKSEYRNSNWSHPTSLSDHISPDGTAAINPRAALDDNGNVIIVWEQIVAGRATIFKSEYRNSSWTHPASLNEGISPDGMNASLPQVAKDDNGNAIIVWQQYDGTKLYIFKSEYRNNSWIHPAQFSDHISPNDGQTASDPQVAMSNNGEAVIIWRQGGDNPNLAKQIYKSEYRNNVWAHPSDVNDFIGPSGGNDADVNEPRLAIDDYGNTIITWSQYDDLIRQKHQLFMSEYRSGIWTHPDSLGNNISPVGSVWSSEVSLDNKGNAIIVWDGSYGMLLAEYRRDNDIDGYAFNDCNDDDLSINPEVAEVCDGVDNNCNGLVDEGCPCDYNDDPDGVCGTATVSSATGLCDVPIDYEATETICDGLDNDCSGVADDIASPSLCANQAGVCSGAVQTCGGVAGWQACSDTEYSTNDPAYETVETTCDGFDNDCDGTPDEGCPTLIISEYTDTDTGGDSLEIYNVSLVPIDTSGCVIDIYLPGASQIANTVGVNGIVLTPGETHVICQSGTISSACDQTEAQLSWIGIDPIVLGCPFDSWIDSIGQVGVFPPTGMWGVAPTSTFNQTLRRKCSVTSGDTNPNDFYDPAPEWDGFPTGDFSDLGQHICP